MTTRVSLKSWVKSWVKAWLGPPVLVGRSSAETVVVSGAFTPFECVVPQSEIDDLRRRLRATRWPEDGTVPGRVQGLPLGEVRELCRYWADDYDWRAAERRLNAWPQVMVEIDGLPVHVLHAR